MAGILRECADDLPWKKSSVPVSPKLRIITARYHILDIRVYITLSRVFYCEGKLPLNAARETAVIGW